MSKQVDVKFTGKCTSCRKTFEVTPDQLQAARELGCVMSPCCQDVATVERVEVKLGRKR